MYFDIEMWKSELIDNTDENITVMVIGNKSDLHHSREVSFHEAKEFCDADHMKIIEASALESSNIEQAFETLIFNIYHRMKEAESQRMSTKIRLDQNDDKQNDSFCQKGLKCK